MFHAAAQAGWDSKEDDKSESTLEAMTDKDLFNEAFDVCVRRAMVERQGSDEPGLVTGVTEDASNYLGVIDQVVSKSNGGIAPSWMLELRAAHTVKKCQGAFRTFLVAQQPRKRTRSQEGGAARGEEGGNACGEQGGDAATRGSARTTPAMVRSAATVNACGSQRGGA